jgi:flagellar biogenesis protein FliO
MEQLLPIMFFSIGFVLVLLAAHFTTRWIGKKIGGYSTGKYFCILDRVYLGNECFICLLRIGGNCYIVGVTKSGMQVLDRIEGDDIKSLPTTNTLSFPEIFQRYFNSKREDIEGKERQEPYDRK